MADGSAPHRRDALAAFVAPFVAFLILTSIEGMAALKPYYPFAYAAKMAVIAALIWRFRVEYPKFESRGVPLGVAAGVLGLVAWVLLERVSIQEHLPESIRSWVGSARVGYNPFEEIESPAGRWAFLAIRLFGLAVIVPIIEELFWRGFLARFLVDEHFEKVPIGVFSRLSFAVVTLGFTLEHPELLAALVWGLAINGVYWKTRNLWACIAMHATTNALLGVYVLATGTWRLW